jgi:hypothetical protein
MAHCVGRAAESHCDAHDVPHSKAIPLAEP